VDFGTHLNNRGSLITSEKSRLDLPELGVMAEQRGFDCVWLGDSQFSKPRFKPPLSPLSQRTSSTRLCTACLVTPHCHGQRSAATGKRRSNARQAGRPVSERGSDPGRGGPCQEGADHGGFEKRAAACPPQAALACEPLGGVECTPDYLRHLVDVYSRRALRAALSAVESVRRPQPRGSQGQATQTGA
jgi:hypothetical protein